MRREACALGMRAFDAAFEMERIAGTKSLLVFAPSPEASASRNLRTCVRTAEVMPWLRARCLCACRFCFSADFVLATLRPRFEGGGRGTRPIDCQTPRIHTLSTSGERRDRGPGLGAECGERISQFANADDFRVVFQF